jgi:hypothetical protein
MKTLSTSFAAVAASMLLAACGGSDRSEAVAEPAVIDTVPASASASPLAYTEFARALVASETAPPLQMDAVAPPTSESDAPLPLN